MPFSLDLVPTAQKKRSPEEGGEVATTQPEKKVRVSDIVLEQQGPRPQKTASRRPETAPWHICVYKVTDCAGDMWSNYESDDAGLYAVLMEHEARQSALLYLRDAFNAYLASARVENAAIPQDLPALQEQCGIRLIVADAQDGLF